MLGDGGTTAEQLAGELLSYIMRTEPYQKAGKILILAALLILFYLTRGFYSRLDGIRLILFTGFHLTLLLFSLRFFVLAVIPGIASRKMIRWLFLLWTGLWLAIVVSEITLEALSMTKSNREVQMPDELKKRKVNIPGSVNSFYWHKKLHVHNADGFRTTGTYTMDANAFRILVLGDSVTYGYGISEMDTYPAVLEKELKRFTNVKVYNLGRPGYQSEEILNVARDWVPVLQPHLTIYGVCLNDFLPAGKTSWASNRKYQIPFPRKMKEPLIEKTRTGAILARGYDQLLLRSKLRNDFYDDILSNSRGYQSRFRKDLAAMNEFVKQQTGSSVILIVVNATPNHAKARRITVAVEDTAGKAGMRIVSLKQFYEKYSNGKVRLLVSRWEQHPNEIAHKSFAEMILPVVKNDPAFVNYNNGFASSSK